MTHQETFIQIYQEHIHRRGADQLLAWLQSDASDFFTAPSSTRYHGSYEGGLVEHSLNVYHCLVDYLARPRTKELYGMDYSDETVALVALMHDICKVNFYAVDYRNAKNERYRNGGGGVGRKFRIIRFGMKCHMDTGKNPSICCRAFCG